MKLFLLSDFPQIRTKKKSLSRNKSGGSAAIHFKQNFKSFKGRLSLIY